MHYAMRVGGYDGVTGCNFAAYWNRPTIPNKFDCLGVFMANSMQTVIGVPGRWRDRSDIVTSIASRSGGYLFAGMIMMKIGTKDGFTLEVYEYDPNLAKAFSIAGRGRLTEEDLEAVGSHTFILYLSSPGGTVDAAKNLLHAAEGCPGVGATEFAA